jgi:hypothetical protein
VFHTRCPRFIGDICVNEEPALREVEPDHFWRCHHDIETLRELQQSAPERRNGHEPASESRSEAAGVRPEADSAPAGDEPPGDPGPDDLGSGRRSPGADS